MLGRIWSRGDHRDRVGFGLCWRRLAADVAGATCGDDCRGERGENEQHLREFRPFKHGLPFLDLPNFSKCAQFAEPSVSLYEWRAQPR
jgi:hypothetical protein